MGVSGSKRPHRVISRSPLGIQASWIFCRFPLTRNAVLLATPFVQAFDPGGPTMPSADFCRPVRLDYSPLSPDSRTNGRSPEVSSTAFGAQPPDLQPAPLMDLDFVVICRLVRRRMPRIRFLFIGSHLCSTLPSDPASRRRPCASLGLHLHQVVQGTSTLKLPNMLGTQRKPAAPEQARRAFSQQKTNP